MKSCNRSIWLIIVLSLFILDFIAATPFRVSASAVYAAEITFSSSAGYSSNPALEPDRLDTKIKDSPFSTHTLLLEERFKIGEKFAVDFSPSITYQNLWELPDNHQVNVGLSLSPAASRSRFSPYIFANALLYRDDLVEPDQRDEFTLGAGAEIILSGRYTFAFESAWQCISYLKDAPIFFRETQNFNNLPNPNTLTYDESLNMIYSAKDDVNMMLKTRLDIFLLPALTASVGLNYDYLVSSLDAESFWQITPNIKVVWDFAQNWQFTALTQVERRNYFDIDKVLCNGNQSANANGNQLQQNASNYQNITIGSGTNPQQEIREINYTASLNLRAAYFWNNVEIFTDFLVEHGEYPLNRESYNQKVIQCGFSWSF